MYRVVYRFDTGEHLRAWLDSDEHVEWLARLEPHAAGPLMTWVVMPRVTRLLRGWLYP